VRFNSQHHLRKRADLPPDDPRSLVADINARDAHGLVALATRAREDRRSLEACRRFSLAVTGPVVGGDLDAWPGDGEGARAVRRLLFAHPSFEQGRRVQFTGATLGRQAADPAEFDARRETAEFLAVGLSALSAEGPLDARQMTALFGVAFGADAWSRFTRAAVLGLPRGLDLDLNFEIPPRLIDLESLDRRACVRGLQDAALDLTAGARAARAWATGITALDPPTGCAGDVIVIRGDGFGATRPDGVVVMFPRKSGGCAEARVTAWSDDAVTVVVPDVAGPGCVGFAEPGTPPSVEAALVFAGELERCIGPAAFRVSNKIRVLAGIAPPPPCPGCLDGGANRFSGGPAVIDAFTANSGHDVVVEPGGLVVLQWTVRNAQTISLTRTSQQGPFAPPPTPLPASGRLEVGPFTGNAEVSATYRLTAANGCATDARTVVVHLRKTPNLSIAAIEIVQVIQRPNNSVRLVAGKRTVARVFVDSGVSDGFNFGSGPDIVPDIVPGIVGNVLVFPAGRGFGTSGTPLNSGTALAVPAAIRNRNLPLHSLTIELPVADLEGPVRIDASVAVAGHENDVGGPWKAVGSATVVFQPRPPQEVLPFLVSDFLNLLAAPPLSAYAASLQEARKRFPVDEVGFIVHPALPLVASNFLGSPYNLASATDWGLLLFDIMNLVFLFPSTPTGGIRTALVPRSDGTLIDAAGNTIPAYGVNGMASPRVGAYAPTMICQAALPGTFAHEMGHTMGLGHAPCPAPPGMPGGGCMTPPDGIDSRLPGRTDETGFDVPAGLVINTGRGEMMSYCGDLSACPGATRWPSIVTWDLSFNTLPIS
jgi:hypothetical protein